MKLVYIPYINGPKSTAPSMLTGTRVDWMIPSQWREKLEADFLADPATQPLMAAVTTARGDWDGANGKTRSGVCRPKYVNALHIAKEARQQAWIAYLEKAVCAGLDTAISSDPDHAKPGTLIVAALPEFFWRDINDLNKHVSDPTAWDFIAGYGAPFYPSVLNRFVGYGQITAAPAPQPLKKYITPPPSPAGGAAAPTPPSAPVKTLRELTAKYRNLVVFAGTVWWKKIVDTGGCKLNLTACAGDKLPAGSREEACTSLARRREKMYNTLPVFYQGNCVSLWNKQWISHIDGLRSTYDRIEKYFDRSFQLSQLTGGAPTMSVAEGSIFNGTLSSENLSAEPKVELFLQGLKITFGMDICLDFVRGYDRATNKAKENVSMSSCLLGSKPDIQMLVAGGMGYDGRYAFAKECVLRCDALESPKDCYAQVISNSGKWANAIPNAAPSPFQVGRVDLPNLKFPAPVTPAAPAPSPAGGAPTKKTP